MKPNTRIALAGLLSAAGSLLNAFAAEFGADAPEAATPADAPTPKRGKKTTEKPAETAPVEPAAEPPAEEPATMGEGKTYEELRALIEPLVKAGQGEDVKKVIAKYAANLKELATKPEHHAAFEKDLAALAY